MIPVGFDFALLVRFIAGLAIVGCLWWVADAIGDAREARVWARINESIAKTNKDIDAALSLDDKIAAIAEQARKTALANAQAVPAPPACIASPEQAAALSQIK